MKDAAGKHSGRRHAVPHRRARVVWVATAAVLATVAAAGLWQAGNDNPTTPVVDVALGAEQVTPEGTEESSPTDTSDAPDPSLTSEATSPTPGTTPPPITGMPVSTAYPSAPVSTQASTHGSGSTAITGTRTGSSTRPTTRQTSSRPATTQATTRASTSTSASTSEPTGAVRPCSTSCILARNWFDTGTQGWVAPSGGTLTRSSIGYRDSASLHASGVTTTSGPSLTINDRRLSGPNRRWVSARIRVRVSDDGGARLRLRVSGAQDVRMRELPANGDWQILRAWFLPNGPVTLSVVAAPSRCSTSPSVDDLYLDDVLVSVIQVGETPFGVESPYLTCW